MQPFAPHSGTPRPGCWPSPRRRSTSLGLAGSLRCTSCRLIATSRSRRTRSCVRRSPASTPPRSPLTQRRNDEQVQAMAASELRPPPHGQLLALVELLSAGLLERRAHVLLVVEVLHRARLAAELPRRHVPGGHTSR